jgi:hypothetical protein
MRSMAFATAVALVLTGPALAQAPVATAPAAGAPAPQPTAATPPLSTEEDAPAEGPQMAMGPCGPEKVLPNGKLDTAAHGQAEVGVGTGGYRHIGAAVCQPIGQNAAVAVSISQTEGRYRRH